MSGFCPQNIMKKKKKQAVALTSFHQSLCNHTTGNARRKPPMAAASAAVSSELHFRSTSDGSSSDDDRSSFHGRSPFPASNTRPSLPRTVTSSLGSIRLSSDSSYGARPSWRELIEGATPRGGDGGDAREPRPRAARGRRRKAGQKRTTAGAVLCLASVAFFLFVNWWMFSMLQSARQRNKEPPTANGTPPRPSSLLPRSLGEWNTYEKIKKPRKIMFKRLLALASHALAEAEDRPEPKDLWKEDMLSASSWKPCADQSSRTYDANNGYILVSANGGINQQRIAICNAVAIARLLNSTLILPKFLYSNVWRDTSQFSDIYQADHFINYLRDDIPIMKELPLELQSLDLEAIGSVVTDDDIKKESKPSFYLKKILPIILKNKAVHLIGFGNRLAFDPIPFELQRLRCRCNFHALRFAKKIQETGTLLVKRMHHHASHWGPLEENLLGPFDVTQNLGGKRNPRAKKSKYLAMHLRFEIDMVAYSLCYFGGGREEREELETYREIHFPSLMELKKADKLPAATILRSEGKCPLAPEEAVLMLAALGFKRKTSIYIAGAHIYGEKSRMAALTNLYPELVTKESLLSSAEIEPFLNFSSQLAALDFIVSASADMFAMTDSGSQFAALVSGYRIYYGSGELPTIRPNKRRLADIFSKNSTIQWNVFEKRVQKTIRQSKKVLKRPTARSVYRHPRCPQCMCQID